MKREERARECMRQHFGKRLTAFGEANVIAAMLAFADAEAAAMRELAAASCEEQATVFLSPEYATGQPFSSLSERFACGQCAEAIRALPATGEVGRG